MSAEIRKLRIAFVRQRYTAYGGAERFLDLAIDSLGKFYDVEVFIIARSWRGPQQNNRNRFIKCDPFFIGRMWRDWSFYRSACKEIQKHQFDIVQSHERAVCGDIYRAGEGVHRGWLAQRSRTLTILQKVTMRLSPYHRFMLRQEKKVFENKTLKAIIANSSVIANEIEQFFPTHTAKIEIIHNAVDTSVFNPNLKAKFRKQARAELGISDEAYVCLFVGSGYERKGVPLLLEIFERLTPSIHLIVVGKDKSLQALRKKNKTERIHLLGAKEDVRPLYSAADLFVFPSLYDPMPNSALEAAASGLPVLASSTTGAADLAESMAIATLDPLDRNSWINAINAFANRRAKSPPLQDLTVLSQERLADRLFQLYRSLLEPLT